MPARHAAISIFSLLSRSARFSTDFGSHSKIIFTACSEQPSEKSFFHTETYPSTAWVKASIPVYAVSSFGSPTTNSGSRIAISGVNSGLRVANFLPVSSSRITMALVASEPVPVVVGIHTSFALVRRPRSSKGVRAWSSTSGFS